MGVIQFRRRHARASTEAFIPKIAGSTSLPSAPSASVKAKKYPAGTRPRAFQLETTRLSIPTKSAAADVPPKASIICSTDVIMLSSSPQIVDLSTVHGIVVESSALSRPNLWMAALSRDATAHRLLVLRTMTGQSQEQMGGTVGCGKTAWSNYESPGQDRLIDVAIAVRLCDRYGVTLDWIYRNIAFGVPEQVLQGLDKTEKDIAADVGASAPVRMRKRAAKHVGKSRRHA